MRLTLQATSVCAAFVPASSLAEESSASAYTALRRGLPALPPSSFRVLASRRNGRPDHRPRPHLAPCAAGPHSSSAQHLHRRRDQAGFQIMGKARLLERAVFSRCKVGVDYLVLPHSSFRVLASRCHGSPDRCPRSHLAPSAAGALACSAPPMQHAAATIHLVQGQPGCVLPRPPAWLLMNAAHVRSGDPSCADLLDPQTGDSTCVRESELT